MMLNIFIILVTLVSVWLLSKGNVWGWGLSTISSWLMLHHYLGIGLLGQAIFMGISLSQGVYGFFKWNVVMGVIKSLDKSWVYYLLILGLLFVFFCTFFGINANPNYLIMLDYFGMTMAIIGTILLINMYTESWLFFILSNMISIILLLNLNDLYFACLNLILLIISFNTIFRWEKGLK